MQILLKDSQDENSGEAAESKGAPVNRLIKRPNNFTLPRRNF